MKEKVYNLKTHMYYYIERICMKGSMLYEITMHQAYICIPSLEYVCTPTILNVNCALSI